MGSDFQVRFTDKPITPYAGIHPLHSFYKNCGLQDILNTLDLPQPGSNRGYNPEELLEGFFISVILGARRFAHTGKLRYDQAISELCGWKNGMASESTFTRFFRKFDINELDSLFIKYGQEWFDRIKLSKHTIDIDSTVITRYCTQDGVEVGYNPKKPGRGSHHPIIAFSAEAKMVIQAWMRTGNSASNTDIKEFYELILKTIGKRRIGLIRGDSGFFSDGFMKEMESDSANYILAAKMYASIRQKIFDQDTWHPIAKDLHICSFEYQMPDWQVARRFVVVRKRKSTYPKSGGKSLFPEYDEFEDYLYSAFVTNLELSDELIWEIYKHRAEAETQIRELKENYAIDGFASEDFAATEAAFRWVCVAYNLVSLYKLAMINRKHDPTLPTLTFYCIAIAGYLSRHAGKRSLVIAAKGKKRNFLEDLFQKMEQITPESRFIPKKKFLMH